MEGPKHDPDPCVSACPALFAVCRPAAGSDRLIACRPVRRKSGSGRERTMSHYLTFPLRVISPAWLAATSLAGVFTGLPAYAAETAEAAATQPATSKRPVSRCDLIGETYLCRIIPAAPSSTRPDDRSRARPSWPEQPASRAPKADAEKKRRESVEASVS